MYCSKRIQMKADNSTNNVKCPICAQEQTWRYNNSYRPFCSKRCRLIDLGGWAEERYSIDESKS